VFEHRDVWFKRFGEGGLLIRDLVSDADKLEALGAIGYERCVQFARHRYPTYNKKQLADAVMVHYNEKLAHLASDYLVTPSARLRGEIATAELKVLILKGCKEHM
jgi:hypothetical protein